MTELHDVPDSEEVPGEEFLLQQERRSALRTGFACLATRCRELLLLLFTDPLLLFTDPPVEYAAISSRLGIPVGSIGPTGRAVSPPCARRRPSPPSPATPWQAGREHEHRLVGR